MDFLTGSFGRTSLPTHWGSTITQAILGGDWVAEFEAAPFVVPVTTVPLVAEVPVAGPNERAGPAEEVEGVRQ